MPTLKEVQPPEPYGKPVFTKFAEKIIGFDEWCAKNKAEHYRKRDLQAKEKNND